MKYLCDECFQEYCMICLGWKPYALLDSIPVDMSEFENQIKKKRNITKKKS